MSCDTKTFRAMCARLRSVEPVPPAHVLRVRRVPMSQLGECVLRANRFTIHARAGLTEIETLDVLIHEWAHMLTWGEPGKPHGRLWGETYARVLCAYHEIE